MNDQAIAWARLGHLHVLVFGEVGRNLEVLILIRSGGFERELFGHGEDHIGFADAPAINELRRRWQVFRIPFLSATINPRGDRVNLGLRHPPVVLELLRVRVGVPGRHLAFDDFLFD